MNHSVRSATTFISSWSPLTFFLTLHFAASGRPCLAFCWSISLSSAGGTGIVKISVRQPRSPPPPFSARTSYR